MDRKLLPLKLAAWMCVGAGAILLAAMVWISTWPREAPGGAYVTPLLPGHRFLPEILPRLGEIGGGAAGLGLALLVAASLIARRARRT